MTEYYVSYCQFTSTNQRISNPLILVRYTSPLGAQLTYDTGLRQHPRGSSATQPRLQRQGHLRQHLQHQPRALPRTSHPAASRQHRQSISLGNGQDSPNRDTEGPSQPPELLTHFAPFSLSVVNNSNTFSVISYSWGLHCPTYAVSFSQHATASPLLSLLTHAAHK